MKVASWDSEGDWSMLFLEEIQINFFLKKKSKALNRQNRPINQIVLLDVRNRFKHLLNQ